MAYEFCSVLFQAGARIKIKGDAPTHTDHSEFLFPADSRLRLEFALDIVHRWDFLNAIIKE